MKTERRQFLKTSGALPLFLLSGSGSIDAANEDRPNVLWIIGEDLCPDLGCYGNKLVKTPNLDRLASEGVRFTNAFTTAPVCSAARSALITGMYQTSIGAHHHRSHRDDGYRLPDGVRLVTDYFRDVGFFTANISQVTPQVKGTAKTDFNFTFDKSFDGNDWSQRKPGQPFYAQINFPESHRTFKRAKTNPVDPADVEIPPYYPDHPITRGDWALYLDTIGYLDEKVGVVLKRLEEEGIADNTIVIFMGDHGRCMVRGKQWLYDGGIHVPLIVRWPGKIKPGSVRGDLISSIDITATSLACAGIDVPKTVQGHPFLGDNINPRDYIAAARDRCDETMDRIRCIRDRHYKYIRNFMPERPYTQLNRYKECEYPVLRLMRRLHDEGKLTPEQELFMADTRPKEELYDVVNDPNEIHNLADDPKHAATLEKMRGILDQWIHETGDKGETPEDPAITEQFKQQMMKNYDKKIMDLYSKEKMDYTKILK